jgi:CRISPR/Cas system-associated endonuclease Cas1
VDSSALNLLDVSKRTGDKRKAEMAIARLKKALSCCSSQNHRELEPEIWQTIFKAKKLLFFLEKDDYEREARAAFEATKVG